MSQKALYSPYEADQAAGPDLDAAGHSRYLLSAAGLTNPMVQTGF
jgi:hypothetical protein